MRRTGRTAVVSAWWLVLSALVLITGRCSLAQGTGNPLRTPSAIAYDSIGNLFLADTGRNQVLEATVGGTLVVIAGTGVQGFSGDGGSALAAELNGPEGVAVSSGGTVYVSDTRNHRIRMVDSKGIISTLAGTGQPGFGGDAGAATAAKLRLPTALAVDAQGAVLVCDTGNHRLRRIATGSIATVAGSGIQGFGGDGGVATGASLDSPMGVTVAADGRIFIADTHNHRVRVIGMDATMRTFAGTGQRGFAGDGGAATSAQLNSPRGLAITAAGDLLIADAANQRVRKVDVLGVIASVAGNGIEGTVAEGNAVLTSPLRVPRAVAQSPFGQASFAEPLDGTIRVIASDGISRTPAALTSGRTSLLSIQAAKAQIYGAATAVVTVAGVANPPQGTAEVFDGGMSVGRVTLNGAVGRFDLSSLSTGAHNLSLTYTGDGVNPAASSSASLTVSPAPVIATPDSVSVIYGSPLPVFSGTLTGVLAQDVGQVFAVYTTGAGSMPDVGSYPIDVALTGARSGNYVLGPGNGPALLTVARAASTTTLLAIVQTYPGIATRLSANVAPSAKGAPGGTVRFVSGNTLLASATVVNGSASVPFTPTSAGALQITAAYDGDGNFLPSSSAIQSATVAVLPDFAISAAGSGSATVSAGQSAAYAVNLTGAPGPFTGAISLSVSGLPNGATVSFSPQQVIPGNASATVNVTVQTSASVGALQRPGAERNTQLAVPAAALLLACFGLRKRRFVLMSCVVGAWLLSGCGARTVTDGASSLPTSYTLQVTGTATNLAGQVVTHSLPLTLSIQ